MLQDCSHAKTNANVAVPIGCYRMAKLPMLSIALPHFVINQFIIFRQLASSGPVLSFVDA